MATHSNILAWKIPWTEEPEIAKNLASKQQQRHSTLCFFDDLN